MLLCGTLPYYGKDTPNVSTVSEFIRDGLRGQHAMIDRAVKDLTPDQLHWLPPDTKLNHIGNTLWHYVRTEDNVVQFVLQDRKPTVWIEGGYNEKFGLDKIAQGTGMSTEDAHAMRLPAMDEWMVYQQAVWQATYTSLAGRHGVYLAPRQPPRPFAGLSPARALPPARGDPQRPTPWPGRWPGRRPTPRPALWPTRRCRPAAFR